MSDVLDIAPFIEAQSDRIIGDDLIAGPQTFNVTRLDKRVEEGKKRLVLHLDGSDRPFIPCKGMVRLLGHLWGGDLSKWPGRSLTLYRDPDVRFGADTTGGVRICAASHIDKAERVPIRTSQKKVKAYDVKPLEAPAATSSGREKAEAWAANHIAGLNAAGTRDVLDALHAKGQAAIAKLAAGHADLHDAVQAAHAAKLAEFTAADEPDADDFGD